jgi:hypothetical protein
VRIERDETDPSGGGTTPSTSICRSAAFARGLAPPGPPDHADGMAPFDSFLGEPIVGWTDHFLVTVSSDTPAARAAAQAIVGSAEGDLHTLEGWFSYSWDDFPYGIWVSVGDDGTPGPHASNTWFGTSDTVPGTGEPTQDGVSTGWRSAS